MILSQGTLSGSRAGDFQLLGDGRYFQRLAGTASGMERDFKGVMLSVVCNPSVITYLQSEIRHRLSVRDLIVNYKVNCNSLEVDPGSGESGLRVFQAMK